MSKYLTSRPRLSGRIALALVAIGVIVTILLVTFTAQEANAKPAEGQNEPRPVVTWDACRFDDGSNPPCVWDARHFGNTIGRSFKAIPRSPDCPPRKERCDDPRIVYITHARAHLLVGLP